jgi:gas vesicle protein
MKNTAQNNGRALGESARKANRSGVDSAHDSSGSKIMPFLLGAIVGGIAGAAVALLYAPVEGSEVRREVGEKLEDVSDGINRVLKVVKVAAEKMFNEGRGDTEEITSRTRERADDLIEDADRAIEEARKRAANLGLSAEDESRQD